jgi:anti-sigma factor RsiW
VTTFSGHLTDAMAQRVVDGVLAGAEAPEVMRHLAGCLDCQGLVASYEALSGALDGLAAPELPADFTEGVLALVDVRERAARRDRRLAAGIVLGAAAALVAVLALAGARSLVPAISGLAGEATEAIRAVRISSGILPTLVSAFRLPLLLATAVVAVPVLLGIARLIPSPQPARAEAA